MFTRRLTKFIVLGAVLASLAGISVPPAAAETIGNLNVTGGKCWYKNTGGLSVFHPKITHPGDGYYSTWNYSVYMRRWTVVVDAATKNPIGPYHYIGQWTLAPYGTGSFGEDTLEIPANRYGAQIQSITQYFDGAWNLLETDRVTATSYTVYRAGEYFGWNPDLGTYGSCANW